MSRQSFLLLMLFCIGIKAFSQISDNKILSYSTHCRLEGKTLVEEYHIKIFIANSLGDDLADVEIYSSGNYNVKNINAVTTDIFGKEIKKLKSRDIENTIDYYENDFHTDSRINRFSLFHNRYPYILEYSYKYEHRNYIDLANWYPISYKNIPVKKADLSVRVPKSTKVEIRSHFIDTTYIKESDDYITYCFEKSDYVRSKDESFAPVWGDTEPHVVVMPNNFFYGSKGNATSWKTFGEWTVNNNRHMYKLTDEEKLIVDKIVKDCTSDREKVKLLYHYLQDNTRYINVSLETGGLIPYSATYVCNNKYGDCKALTVYMKAILKYVGIESSYTIIYAGYEPDKVDVDLPSNQFNHIILQVPLEKDTVWLENTSKSNPFNYLGSFTQNRFALAVKGEDSKLVKTPAISLTQALTTTNVEVHIGRNGMVNFIADIDAGGASFDNLNSFDNQLSLSDQKQFINRQGYIRKAEVDSFYINKPHRDSSHIRLFFNGKLNNIAEDIGNRLMVYPVKPYYFDLESKENRTKDISISQPTHNKDCISYIFDKEIDVAKGVKSISVNSDFGSYTFNYIIEGKKLIVKSHFALKQGVYSKDKYDDFYDFMHQVEKTSNSRILLTFK